MMPHVPKVEVVEREARVVELRRAGMTYQEIANVVGVRPDSVRTIFMRALRRALDNAGVDEARTLEADRLDRLQRAVWPKALTGDLPAVHSVIRIMERRAKLLGLDAPIQVNATVEHLDPNSIDAEVARLASLLQQSRVGGGRNEINSGDISPPTNPFDGDDIIDAEIVGEESDGDSTVAVEPLENPDENDADPAGNPGDN